MNIDRIVDLFLNDGGGIFGLGCAVGGGLVFKYISPKVYGAKIAAMEERIEFLERELAPYKSFLDDLAKDALRERSGH